MKQGKEGGSLEKKKGWAICTRETHKTHTHTQRNTPRCTIPTLPDSLALSSSASFMSAAFFLWERNPGWRDMQMKGCGYANEGLSRVLTHSLSFFFFQWLPLWRPLWSHSEKVTSAADCPRDNGALLARREAGWESHGKGRGSRRKPPRGWCQYLSKPLRPKLKQLWEQLLLAVSSACKCGVGG